MPGRQAHGNPVLASSGSAPRDFKKSRSKAKRKALDAFALAEEQTPHDAKGVRRRNLEPEDAGHRQKRQREDDEGNDDAEEEESRGRDDILGGPNNRRARNDDEEIDGASDNSDGEQWHVGVGEEDEDSEIDSDDAFGESDEERFEGFTFRGSSSKDIRGDPDEGSDAEDDESLGSDAIDLAQALDRTSDDEDSANSGEFSSEDGDQSSSESELDDEDDDAKDEIPEQRKALRNLISDFAGDDEEDAEATKSSSLQTGKIALKDLGLSAVKDPFIKKSLKLMNKEEKATKPGSRKKLEVPLAKRQQDTLLRNAAYEKASETLDRWTDTVKHNRRADHLVFPLVQDQVDLGLSSRELQPLQPKDASTTLEQTIMAIMEESGLGPSSQPKKNIVSDEAQQPTISRSELKEIWNERRRDREIRSREDARAKRIKKIKSKAYHRVHRKEKVREELAAKEALAAAGEIDAEEEQANHDRRRALERVGAKHKESKWAKMGSKAGRAVWDEDFRTGLTDMARKDAELRRRVEGRTGESDGSEDDSDDVSDDPADSKIGGAKVRLLEELDRAAADDDTPRSNLMKMKFMQRGEEELRRANDELVKQIRRDLRSGDEDSEEDDEEKDLGRRQYGMAEAAKKNNPFKVDGGVQDNSKSRKAKSTSVAPHQNENNSLSHSTSEVQTSVSSVAGAWSKAGQERRKKKSSKSQPIELDLTDAAMLATKPAKSQRQKSNDAIDGQSSEDEDPIHLPITIRDQDLIKRAFAGEDVVGEFEREKAAIEEEDNDKEVDNTLPGWGSWVGEGVSNRDMKRHSGRFVTKVEGVKKKDRKDFKLERVIVNEKRIKKNDKFLASQLPHPFESRSQYERSLRLPVGQEWMTKETFQDATKPRVIIKPGIIAPMSKPIV